MTIFRANKLARAHKLPKWPQFFLQAAAYAILALLALSQVGCATKRPPQPSTVQEFLKQPRPQ
ncbi:MAG TPA: hypothetical protein VG826_16200 [Pirellulales bacterium]|nr:hypothetical protein [Pirellulales bacterium]